MIEKTYSYFPGCSMATTAKENNASLSRLTSSIGIKLVDCIVTACAMCHMNLEARSRPDSQLPIFHLTELLSMAFGDTDLDAYFNRHLIDPRPYLRQHQLTQGLG